MAYGFRVEVWGDRALFTRPELSVERMTYELITPSAARGILESIFWHPGMRYEIDRIHVINPIAFTSIRRNEVASKASSKAMRSAVLNKRPLPHINPQTDIQQRASVVLTDVRYVIEAHFVMTDRAAPGDNPGKFKDIIRRRLGKGQCYSTPYFGTREFPAHFKACHEDDIPASYYADVEERDFGLMLFDMDYSDSSNITPMFYHPVMRHGVVQVSGSEVFR